MHISLRATFWLSLMQQTRVRAILYMVVSAMCFSIVELAGSYFIRGISFYQLVWGRYAVHLLFMLVILGPRYRTALVRTSSLKLQIIRSLTMLAMPLCFIAAVPHMPAHDIWSLYWLSPLTILALAVFVLREPVGSVRWVAALVGFGAVLLIHRPDQQLFSLAAIPAVGMGVALSLHLLLSRILRHDHPLTSLFHTALWVFVILSLVMPFVWQAPSGQDIIGVIIVGLVGMVGLFTLARAGEIAPLPIIASFAYTEVIWTLLLNLLLFGIIPGRSELLGALVVIGVTIFMFYHETSSPTPAEASHS